MSRLGCICSPRDLLTARLGGGTAALFSAKRLGDNFAELRTNIQKLAAKVKTNEASMEDSRAAVEVVSKDMESLDESLQRHRKRIKELAHNTGILYTRLTALEERFDTALERPLAAPQKEEDPEPVAGTKRKRGEKVRDNNLQVSADCNQTVHVLTLVTGRGPQMLEQHDGCLVWGNPSGALRPPRSLLGARL